MSNPYPTVISFYTQTWEYPNYADKMQIACKDLGLEYYILCRVDTGHWLTNTRMKPQFIYEAILELQRPVLWIDVDGIILQRPELLKEGYPFDFAARKMSRHKDRTWQVGTLYFNYTPEALTFLKEWNRRIVHDTWSDELSLDELWLEQGEEIRKLRVGELPEEYFQMLRGDQSAPFPNSIICHRASKGEDKMQLMKRIRAKRRDLGTGT